MRIDLVLKCLERKKSSPFNLFKSVLSFQTFGELIIHPLKLMEFTCDKQSSINLSDVASQTGKMNNT